MKNFFLITLCPFACASTNKSANDQRNATWLTDYTVLRKIAKKNQFQIQHSDDILLEVIGAPHVRPLKKDLFENRIRKWRQGRMYFLYVESNPRKKESLSADEMKLKTRKFA